MEEAYYFPNLTKAVFGEDLRILVVSVFCVSLVQPTAKVRFPRGGMKWVPFECLASTREKMKQIQKSVKELQAV